MQALLHTEGTFYKESPMVLDSEVFHLQPP